jgi:hypothetical protein
MLDVTPVSLSSVLDGGKEGCENIFLLERNSWQFFIYAKSYVVLACVQRWPCMPTAVSYMS